MRAPEHLVWVADVVDPAPGERILDVGCGRGILVSLLAERLTTGVVVGIDRSTTMIAVAARRNRAAAEAGRVRLHAVALVDADLSGQSFDVVVSVGVRAFWTPPGAEWNVVREVLAPEGRVIVAAQVPDAEAEDSIEEAVGRLAGARGFDLVGVHRGRTAPLESIALELRASPPG